MKLQFYGNYNKTGFMDLKENSKSWNEATSVEAFNDHSQKMGKSRFDLTLQNRMRNVVVGKLRNGNGV
jgi:hypothetical protein